MGCCCCSEDDEYDQRLEADYRTPPRFQRGRAHSVGSDQARPSPQGYQSTYPTGPNNGGTGFRVQTTAPRPSPQCHFCGLQFDASLLDGHQETCRANMKKAAREITVNNGQHVELKTFELDANTEYDDDAVCVVCMSALRSYAIVPCGHLIACGGCAKKLDNCPMCRQPRAGLLFVDPTTELRTTCKHCKNVIHPAYFEGHREVCALQTRLAAQQSQSPANLRPQQSPTMAIQTSAGLNDGRPTNEDDEPDGKHALVPIVLPSSSCEQQLGVDGYSPPQTTNTSVVDGSPSPQIGRGAAPLSPTLTGNKPQNMCIECRTHPIEVALIPCGHSCLCAGCSAKATMCPLCFSDVQRVLQTFK